MRLSTNLAIRYLSIVQVASAYYGKLKKLISKVSLPHRPHYTAATLVVEQTNKIEETMWVALRMFEERRNLLTTLAKRQTGDAARSAEDRGVLSQIYIDRIRTILLADDNATKSDLPSYAALGQELLADCR